MGHYMGVCHSIGKMPSSPIAADAKLYTTRLYFAASVRTLKGRPVIFGKLGIAHTPHAHLMAPFRLNMLSALCPLPCRTRRYLSLSAGEGQYRASLFRNTLAKFCWHGHSSHRDIMGWGEQSYSGLPLAIPDPLALLRYTFYGKASQRP